MALLLKLCMEGLIGELIGEQIVYQFLKCPSYIVGLSVNISNIYPETTGPIELEFYMKTLGWGNQSLFK